MNYYGRVINMMMVFCIQPLYAVGGGAGFGGGGGAMVFNQGCSSYESPKPKPPCYSDNPLVMDLIRASQAGDLVRVQECITRLDDIQAGRIPENETTDRWYAPLVSLMRVYDGTYFTVQRKEGQVVALGKSIEQGHIDIARVLLAIPDITLTDTGYSNPLAIAARMGCMEVVRAIMNHSRFDGKELGPRALENALIHDHHEVAEVLIADKRVHFAPDVLMNVRDETLFRKLLDDPRSRFSCDVLRAACWLHNEELIRMLLADSRIRVRRSVALNQACKNGEEALVRILLADPRTTLNYTTSFHLLLGEIMGGTKSPLIAAFEAKKEAVVRILLADDRIDLNSTHETKSALCYAVESKLPDIVAFFLRHPRLIIEKSSFYYPLSWAIATSTVEIVQMLLNDARIDVNHVGHYGNALIETIKEGDAAMIALLLTHPRLNPNVTGNWMFDTNPLIEAIKRDQTEAALLLLADSRIELHHTESGETGFVMAARKGNEAIVKAYLDSLAFQMHQDYDKQKTRALAIAQKQEHAAIIQLLTDYNPYDNPEVLIKSAAKHG